jgi:hypothetical protein
VKVLLEAKLVAPWSRLLARTEEERHMDLLVGEETPSSTSVEMWPGEEQLRLEVGEEQKADDGHQQVEARLR